MSTSEKTPATNPFDIQAEAKPNATIETLQPELTQEVPSIPQQNHSDTSTVKPALWALGGLFEPVVSSLLEACDDSPRLLMIIGAPAVVGIALILAFVVLLGISAGLWGLAILFKPIAKKIVKRNLRILVKLITFTVLSVEVAAIAAAAYITVFTVIKCVNRTDFSRRYISPSLKVSWKGVSKSHRETKQD